MALAVRGRITALWRGTASELLKKLAAEKLPKDWPTTPQGLGGRLARAAPALRSLGWTVEDPDRRKKQRVWTLRPPGPVENRGGPDMAPNGATALAREKHGDDRT